MVKFRLIGSRRLPTPQEADDVMGQLAQGNLVFRSRMLDSLLPTLGEEDEPLERLNEKQEGRGVEDEHKHH